MLSQTVGYAISAMSYLASKDEPLLVRELASAVDVPGPYLAKLVNLLSRKGFLSTQRGIGGGVQFSGDPREVTLYSICEALDDPVLRNKCLFTGQPCDPKNPCQGHDFWYRQQQKEIQYLKKTTLSDMVRFNKRRFRKGA